MSPENLKKEFGDKFYKFLITIHPQDIVGELAGKGANSAWAARQVKEQIIDSLKKELKKLQEEKSESEEEKSEDSEKLSAKPRTIAKTLPKEDSFGMFGKSASEGSRELAGILGY